MKKVIRIVAKIIVIAIVILLIRNRNDNVDNFKLDTILDCNNNECKTVVYQDDKIDYMFLNCYEDYLKYKKSYQTTYPKFSDSIKDYLKDFFENNKLIVMEKVNCSIDEITYQDKVAIINYYENKCAYQQGEIDVIEVKQDINDIIFNQK